MTTAKCPECKSLLLREDSCGQCGWGKGKKTPLLEKAGCQFCGAKVVWRNERFSVCLKHYEEQISPHVPASKATIAFQKRLREVSVWISKHPEFPTAREACKHMLEKRSIKIPGDT